MARKTRGAASAAERQHPAPGPQPRSGGWHFAEWTSELVGTFLMLFLGFSVVVVLISPASPLHSAVPWSGLRFVAIGLAFGLLVAAVALSPLGRRSGAHLNPAVTFGFWLRGHIHFHDLAGYTAGQFLGALAAAALLRSVLDGWASRIDDAATTPTVSAPAAAAIECGLTAVLVLVVFGFLSSARTARWTPAAIIVALPVLIRIGAPYTGASMNPARTLGPAVVSGNYRSLCVYLIGPIAGAVCAVLALRLLAPQRTTLTAKLFHDQRYPSTVKTLLPAQPAGSPVAHGLPSNPNKPAHSPGEPSR
jgi:aquaporin Z